MCRLRRRAPSSRLFARSLSALRALSASSLPALGERTEGRGGAIATSDQQPPKTEGTLAGRRGSCVFPGESSERASREGPGGVTLTKRDGERRSHVPAAGTDHAAAVERAQREMLHEGSSAFSVRTAAHGSRPRIG